MPEVGMKHRDYFVQQANALSQFVNRQVEAQKEVDDGVGGKKMITVVEAYQDVGLACGLLTMELMLDIRDMLLQMAIKQDHCHICDPGEMNGGQRQAIVQMAGKGIVLAKDILSGMTAGR